MTAEEKDMKKKDAPQEDIMAHGNPNFENYASLFKSLTHN